MNWQLYHPETQDDEAIIGDVIAVFKALYQQHFAHKPFVNHTLPIEIRAFRTRDGVCNPVPSVLFCESKNV
ncbi:MAG: hypothetical protein HC877_16610 [Thioploca sp.]|nr:hypothetical protein [Thioploca sp.]